MKTFRHSLFTLAIVVIARASIAQQLTVVPSTIDCGTACSGHSSAKVAQIDNLDKNTKYWLHLTEWGSTGSGSSAFSIGTATEWAGVNANGTIGSSYNVQVNFNQYPYTTSTLGTSTETLEIPYYAQSNTSGGPVGRVQIPCTAKLIGNIHLMASPSEVNCGQVNVGSSNSINVTLTNDGQSDASVFAIRHENSDPTFSINPAPPFTVTVGQSTTMTITYSPNVNASNTDYIDAKYHDCSGSEQNAQWHVAGSTPPPPAKVSNDLLQVVRVAVYPNPITANSTISFELNQSSDVRWSIVNPLGEFIRNVALGVMSPGSHSTTIDTNDLENGAYMLLLSVDGQRSVQRLIVTK